MKRIGNTQFDIGTGRVTRDGTHHILEPRLLGLLRYLLANSGRVVGRDELLEAVWGHVEAGSDDSVNTAVSKLRRVLGDSQRPHRIIQTIPRRGYQWVAAVTDVAPPPDPGREADQSVATAPRNSHLSRRWPLHAGSC